MSLIMHITGSMLIKISFQLLGIVAITIVLMLYMYNAACPLITVVLVCCIYNYTSKIKEMVM